MTRWQLKTGVHQHALKEVDAAALAVTKTPSEVVDILSYVLEGRLKGYTD